MSKKNEGNSDLDIFEDLKKNDDEFNSYETTDEDLKLSPLAILYAAVSLIAIIGVTLYGNKTSHGADIAWLRFILCGQLFSGIGVIMFMKARESSSENKNKYSGVMLIVAGIIVVILGVLKKVI